MDQRPWLRHGGAGRSLDGLLRRPGQKPIAVELEMSTKGRRRLQQIISGYAANMGLEQVWYFVAGQDVRHVVEQAAKAHDFAGALGFAPGLIGFLERLEGVEAKTEHGFLVMYLQSHPPTALRIDRLEAMQGVEAAA